MITPARMAALVVGAALLVASASALQAAQAGSNVATNVATAAAPDGAVVRPPAAPATPGGDAESQPQPAPPPRAYLFRGALGPIFSRGMDRLTDRLEGAGIKASVWEFTICRLIADKAIREYREQPAPIVLIGHSMGGLCALTFADILQGENIPVSLVVTVDPAHASPKVPLNVERFINIFLSTSILGGGDIVAEAGYRGHYASFDMKDHDEVTHINIDKLDYVHAQLINMVSEIARVPATSDTNPVPLRYVVPPNVTVELWDSGTSLSVRPGETLARLAADHHVPLWSLAQANRLADNAQLVAGQRIVVPRHLQPAVATAEQAVVETPAAQPAGRKGISIGTRRQ